MLRSSAAFVFLILFSLPSYGESVPENYSDQLEEISRLVADKEEKVGWKGLEEKDKAVALIQIFMAEIGNGGVEQFYSHASGEKTLETLEVLKKIGDTRTAEEFQKTFIFFKGGVPPKDGERKVDPFAEFTPKMQPVFEWFNDYIANVSNTHMHLYVFYKTGRAVSAEVLEKSNPPLFKKDKIFAEIDAAGPTPAFAIYLKLYEETSFKPQEKMTDQDVRPSDVEWRLKWSKSFDSKAVAEMIEKNLKARDESKDAAIKEDHDLFCTGLFSLLEFQTAIDPSLEDRLLKWEKRGMQYDDPEKEVIAETFGPAGVLHKHWPDRYPELTWPDEGKGLKNAEPYLKAIAAKGL